MTTQTPTPTPTTIEKLFVEIFDQKRRIIEKLNYQKQLYDQHLVSKLLIQGITPPPWLLNSGVIHQNSSNSDPKELTKEELISGLLFSHQHSTITHRNSTGFFHHRAALLHADGEMPSDFYYGTSVSSKCFDENEPRILPQARGISIMHTLNDIPASPQDLADAKEMDVCNEAELSLARITRSRSRQRALEIRNSAKAGIKSRLAQESGGGLCFDDTDFQLYGERSRDFSELEKPPAITSGSRNEAGTRDNSDKENHDVVCDSMLKSVDNGKQAKAVDCLSMANEIDVHTNSISRLRDDVTQQKMECHVAKGDKEIVYGGRMTRSRSNIQHFVVGNLRITQVQNEVNSSRAMKCRSCDAKWEEAEDPQHKRRKTGRQMLNRKCHSLTLNTKPFHRTSEDTPSRSLVGLEDHCTLLEKHFMPQSLVAGQSRPSNISAEIMHQNINDSSTILPKYASESPYLESEAILEHRSGSVVPASEHEQVHLSSVSCFNLDVDVVLRSDFSEEGKLRTDSAFGVVSTGMECESLFPSEDKADGSVSEKLTTTQITIQKSLLEEEELDSPVAPLQVQDGVEDDQTFSGCRGLDVPEIRAPIKTSQPNVLPGHIDVIDTPAINESAKSKWAKPEDPQSDQRKVEGLTSNNSSFPYVVEDNSTKLTQFEDDSSFRKQFTPSPRLAALASTPSYITEMEKLPNAKDSMITMPKSAAAIHSLESEATLEYRSRLLSPASEHEQVLPSSSPCTLSEMAVNPQRHFSEEGKIRTDLAVGSLGMECDAFYASANEADGNASKKLAFTQVTVGKSPQREAKTDSLVAPLQVQVVDVVEQDLYEPNPSLPNVVLELMDVTNTHALNGSADSKWVELEDPQSKRRKVDGLPFSNKAASPVLDDNSSYFVEDSSGRLTGFGDDSEQFSSSPGLGALASSPSCIAEMKKLLNAKGSMITMPQSVAAIHYPKGVVDSAQRSGSMTPPTCELEKFMFSNLSCMSQETSGDSQGQSSSGVGKVGIDPSDVLVSSEMQCDGLLCEDKVKIDAEKLGTSDATLIPVEPPRREASLDCSVAAPDMLHLHVVENKETMPVFHRFLVDDQENVNDFFEHCKSTDFSTPLSQLPNPYKVQCAPGVSYSVPNKHIEVRNTINDKVGSALVGKSYSDCFLFPSDRFDWDFCKPYMSPIGKGFEGLNYTSGGSDKLSNSNPELTCFPIEEDPEISEEVLNADKVTETCEVEVFSVGGKKIREPFCDITVENESALFSDTGAKRESLESKSRHKLQGKENMSLSLGANSVKRHTGSHKFRSYKAKVLEKTSLGMSDQCLTEEPKHNNIVSNVKSFIPFVQKNQVAAVPGKRDVKVKALETAEAAKRLAEKKENERKQKKEASKLERARIQQENLRQMELKRKLKEEDQKKKEADAAARKRQREEEERKEKDRKRKRLEEARKQQREQGTKSHAERQQSRHGKVEVMDIEMSGTTTPICDGKKKSVILEVREQSYDISPYQCSDDEEEEEDDIPNGKFIPAWASNSCVTLAISSQKQDPDSIFPPGSFCSLDEVLMPRRLQRKI